MVQTLIEPLKEDIVMWFKKALYSDQCQIVTRLGYTYSFITKLSPSMVKWQAPWLTNRSRDLSKIVKFSDVLASWDDFK